MGFRCAVLGASPIIIATMTLPAALTNSSPAEIDSFSMKQVVALCGDGILADGSKCSDQLREFFKTRAEIKNLLKYMRACLQDTSDESAFVFQDIINEFGRRLDYEVEYGRYRGKKSPGVIGFDGLWLVAGNSHGIVVEVKKSTVFNFNLDVQEGYRKKLIEHGKISANSSILIVVGTGDPTGIENAVLGSQYARGIRIVSADALAKLVQIKENGDTALVSRIHDLFIPFPLVKLDRVIEIAFTAAEEAKASAEEDQGEIEGALPEGGQPEPKKQDRTPPEQIAVFRSAMIEAFVRMRGPLQKTGRVMYWSADKKLRAVFAFSKQYPEKKGGYYYWFAYHSAWDKFLSEGAGFYVLGCFGRNEAYAIPHEWIHSKLSGLNSTETDERTYWHVFLYSTANGGMALWLKNGSLESVSQFKIALPDSAGPSGTATTHQ